MLPVSGSEFMSAEKINRNKQLRLQQSVSDILCRRIQISVPLIKNSEYAKLHLTFLFEI